MGSTNRRAFKPLGVNKTVNVAVTATSQLLAVPNVPYGTLALRMANVGTQTIFIDFVTTTGTAVATTSIPLLANTVEVFTLGNDITHVSAIAGTTGSTLYITYGEGF